MDRLLDIGGTDILKSRIVGWKRSSDEKHNYCMDIVLDSGKSVRVIVYPWDYYSQHESAERAANKYQEIETMLHKEFEIEEDTDPTE